MEFQIQASRKHELETPSLQDILKLLEEKTLALQKSEERFEHMADSHSEWIWETDDQGLYIYCSSALQEILGYAPEEVASKKYFYDLFVPDQKLELKKEVVSVFGCKQSLRKFVNYCLRKDGSMALLETNGSPVIDHAGTLLGYRGTHADITEKVAAQQVRKVLTAAVEQSAEATIITDANGVIEYVNPAFEKITGYPAESVIGKNPNLLKSGNHDTAFYADLWDTIKAGRVWTGSIINRTRDESLIHFETTISPVFDTTGKITNYVSVNRDVTREHLLQAQLIQAQKMEALGMLSAGIAHDFNNLIYAIGGYAELALDNLLDTKQREAHLAKIMEASNRAGEMVKQILSFSRKSDPESRILDISPIVKECLRFLRGTIPATISIDIDVEENIPAIHANPTQIYQILMNLCVNSVCSIGQSHGAINVSLSSIELDYNSCRRFSLDEAGTFVQMTVDDDGKGIPPEILEKIFEPHFTTKTGGKGFGLGLATVMEMVKKHRGAVKVESQPGEGAKFSIFFPAVEKKSAEEPSVELYTKMGAGKKVLCLDDDAGLLPIYQGSLKKLGFTAVTVNTPEEAIEVVRKDQHTLDLIITDLTMPRMTGVEFAREIHSIRPDIPVVICTGYSNFSATPEIAGYGIRDIIYKPVSRNTLARAITGIFDLQPSSADQS